MNRLGIKLHTLIGVVFLLGIFANLNYIAFEHLDTARMDLTDGQRWTLAPVTLEVLEGMQGRFEETVAIEAGGKGSALSEAEKDGLRVHLDFYISDDLPAFAIDLFRETEERLDDIRDAAGDFLRYTVHRLDPERTRLEIEEAEELGLTPSRDQDARGRMRRLFCGLVLRYGDREEVLRQAAMPVDVEAWVVRQIDALRDIAEPALVCVLAPREMRKLPLARPGAEALQEFQTNLQTWIQQQQLGQQEMQQKATQIVQQYQPEVMGKDLRYLMGSAATVKLLDRIDANSPVPPDCDLLLLMRPEATTMSVDALKEIAAYLRTGGTVLALAPRVEYQSLGDAQATEIDLGELGHYLAACGVRVREEVTVQPQACVEINVQQQQQKQAATVGRREENSFRFPFWVRLDKPARAEVAAERALEHALVAAQRRALGELAAFHQRLERVPNQTIAVVLGELSQSLERWVAVYSAEERGLSTIEGEQGLWSVNEVANRLPGMRGGIARLREDREQVSEELDSALLYSQDLRAQLEEERDPAVRRELENQRDAIAAQIEDKRRRIGELESAADECEALLRGINLVRKAYAAWRQRWELTGSEVESDRLSRRSYIRELQEMEDGLSREGALPDHQNDALTAWVMNFDLLYSFDQYLGGSRAVVDALEGYLSAEVEEPEEFDLLLGPPSLVDGLRYVFFPWAQPLQLDEKLVAVDGASEDAKPLRATVVARSAPGARFVKNPAALGSQEYLRRAQQNPFGPRPSMETAMVLEAMNPDKRSEEIKGSQPLVVLLEGRFPPYEKGLAGRALADSLRALSAPLWLGGPQAIDGDEQAPSFDSQAGWRRTDGESEWTLADLASAARQLRSDAAGESKEGEGEGKASGSDGRLLIVPNLYFAVGTVQNGQNPWPIGMALNQLASENREFSSPLLRRMLEWALHGGDVKYASFDARRLEKKRKLKSFKDELERRSPEFRAAQLYREHLARAAAASTEFESGGAQASGAPVAFQIQTNAIAQALDELLEGRKAKPGAASEEDREGLNAVFREVEDDLRVQADKEETRYKNRGTLFLPALLLAALLISLLVGWIRFR